MISNYLLAFNSEKNGFTSSDALITYLDEKYPNWKSLIATPSEFIEFFKTDVHIFQNGWLRNLADEIFDIVPDIKCIESVWNDTTVNEWYRYAAIKRLVSIDSTTYLPIYTTELLSGGFVLGGWGYTMISELYDFPNSVEIVLASNKLTGNNFEHLAQQACQHWQKYPQDLRTEILRKRDYFIRKNCDHTMWEMMTLEEKLYLTTVIVADEYANFHDIISYANFLNDRDVSKVVLLTNKFTHQIHELVRYDESRDRMLNEPPHFDVPEYDCETHCYTPSEQLRRFLDIAQTDSNDVAYNLLNKTIQELRHSEHIIERER